MPSCDAWNKQALFRLSPTVKLGKGNSYPLQRFMAKLIGDKLSNYRNSQVHLLDQG